MAELIRHKKKLVYRKIYGRVKNRSLGVVYVMYDEYDLLEKFVHEINKQTFRKFDLIVVIGYKADVSKVLGSLKKLDGNFIILKRRHNNGPSGGFCIGHLFAYANDYQKIVSVEADCYPQDRHLLEKIYLALDSFDATFCYHKKMGLERGMWIFSGMRKKTFEITGTTSSWIFILWDDGWLQTVIEKLEGICLKIKKIETNIRHLADHIFQSSVPVSKTIFRLPYLTARNNLAALFGVYVYIIKKIWLLRLSIKDKFRIILRLIFDLYVRFVYFSVAIALPYTSAFIISKDLNGMKTFINGCIDGMLFNVEKMPIDYLRSSNINWTLKRIESFSPHKREKKVESSNLIFDTLTTILTFGCIKKKNKFNAPLKTMLVSRPEIVIGDKVYTVEQDYDLNLSRILFFILLALYSLFHLFIFFFTFFNSMRTVYVEQNDVTKLIRN